MRFQDLRFRHLVLNIIFFLIKNTTKKEWYIIDNTIHTALQTPVKQANATKYQNHQNLRRCKSLVKK
jgi:hypothetical protein